jgi:hypothetical protein
MNNDEVIGSVRLSFSVGLKPWNDEPIEYFFPVEGTIIGCLDVPGDSDATEVAGRIAAKVIKFHEAFNDHMDMADIFNKAELGLVHSALFNKKGDFKKKLDIALLPGEIIFIDAITLEPKYQATRLLLQTVETIMPALSPMGLVIARRETLDRGRKEWKQLAFDPVPGTDFVYRDDFHVNPRHKAY